jgi:hypothetical protein
VWLCGSIRSLVLHVVLCGEACRHVDISWTIIYSCTRLVWVNMKEGEQLEGLGVDGSKISK